MKRIVCDKCKQVSDDKSDFVKVYFYPQSMYTRNPYNLDICESCIIDFFDDDVLEHMRLHFNNQIIREEE